MMRTNLLVLRGGAVLIACCGMLSSGLAQDAEGKKKGKVFRKPTWQVGVLLEWIELDAGTANKLLRKHLSKADPKAAPNAFRDEVEKLIDSESATLLDTNYVVTKAGMRATTMSVDEVIYPTEWDPPEIPETVVMLGGKMKPTGAMPMAFELRNAGPVVEVEPTLDLVREVIEIVISPEWVRFQGRGYEFGEEATLPEMSDIWMPKFKKWSMATALKVRNGEAELLSVARPDAEGKLILVFVQGNIID